MAGIRLEWAQFGDFDSFDVLRSDSPMDINALPSPIATGLPTMFYVDTAVVEGATYYYRIAALCNGIAQISTEIKVRAIAELLNIGLVVENGVLTDTGDWQTTWSTNGAVSLSSPSLIDFGTSSGQCLTGNSAFDANTDYKITFVFRVNSFAIGEFDCLANTNNWFYGAFRALVIAGDQMESRYQRRLIVPIYGRSAPTGTTLLQTGIDYAVRIERSGTTVNVYLNDVLEISYGIDRTYTNTPNIIIKGSSVTLKNYKVHKIGGA